MTYKEEIRDLFTVPDDYYLAHCISADFGMGRGIVIEFNKRFNMKNILQSKYPNYVNEYHRKKYNGDCILEDRVLNLITKERYFQKPTYDSLHNALLTCLSICSENNIQKIAMPLIGCGLDRLKWNKVSEIINQIFGNTNIEILVCKI